MAYYLIKYFLKIGLFFYYKKIYTYGLDNIPEKGPVIFACNHPNAFMDGMILSTVSTRKLHFLARGDVFNAGWKRFFLNILHQVPIYRQQEGKENLEKNGETFKRCYSILKEQGSILIFSEGLCVQEKRLRALKKGTARIAFGATLDAVTDYCIDIVPVNINYTYPALAKSEVLITFGKPILLKDYQQLYQETPPLAINKLTADLQKRLTENLIIIEDKAREDLAEKLLFAGRIEYNKKNVFRKTNKIKFEQNICDYVNNLSGSDYLSLKEKADLEFNKIKNFTTSVYSNNYHISLVLFPLIILGNIINTIPLSLALFLTKKQVKHIEFHSSVHFAILLILFPAYWAVLYFFIQTIEIVFEMQHSAFNGTFLFMWISGIASASYTDKLQYLLKVIRYRKTFKNNSLSAIIEKASS